MAILKNSPLLAEERLNEATLWLISEGLEKEIRLEWQRERIELLEKITRESVPMIGVLAVGKESKRRNGMPRSWGCG